MSNITESPIRKSIARNVYGEVWKDKFTNLQLSSRTIDGATLAASEDLLVAAWDSGCGGTLGVIMLDDCGKKTTPVAFVRGHKGTVHDIRFSPFYSTIFATASEDATVKLWDAHSVQPGQSYRDAVAILSGHVKKVSYLAFNHSVDWIIASSGMDCTIRTWDLEVQKCVRTTTANVATNCLKWNWNGSLLAYTTKNHCLRILDPRQNDEIDAIRCHEGAKPTKCEWIHGSRAAGEEFLISGGFSKAADREIALWDLKKLSEPITTVQVDRQSSVITPVYDPGTGLIFVSGRVIDSLSKRRFQGDGYVQFFEFRDSSILHIGVFASTEPARDIAFSPKRSVDVMKCEIMKAYKALDINTIQPVSFIVPRRNKGEFHSELFPPCLSGGSSLTAREWLTGRTMMPQLQNMEPVNGVSPFSTRRRPANVGSLTFQGLMDSMINSPVLSTPSVLEKEMSNRGRQFDAVQGKLQDQVAELLGIINQKDRELKHNADTIESLMKEIVSLTTSLLDPKPQSLTSSKPQSLTSSKRQSLTSSKRHSITSSKRQSITSLASRGDLDDVVETRRELRKIAATATILELDSTAEVFDKEDENYLHSTTRDASADSVVDALRVRNDMLEYRNRELEALFTQLKAASGLEGKPTSHDRRGRICTKGISLCMH